MKNIIIFIFLLIFNLSYSRAELYNPPPASVDLEAVETDIVFDKPAPILQSKDETGATSSETVTIESGSTVDGTSGEINLTTGYESGAGTRGPIRLDSAFLSIFSEGVVTAYAGTKYSLAGDGGMELLPGGSTTPPLKLYEGTGNLFAQLKSTDDGGLQVDAEGAAVTVGLGTGLTPNFWGADPLPGLVIDGENAAALDAFGAGIVFTGDDSIMNAMIVTQDRTDNKKTASIWLATGYGDGSGDVNTNSGDANSASEISGNVLSQSGSNALGDSGMQRRKTGNAINSGDIIDETGTGSTLRGEHIFSSRQARFTNPIVLDDENSLKLKEDSGSGVNFAALKAPTTLANDYNLIAPSAPFTGDQYLASQTLPTTYTPTLSHTSGITSSVFKWHREGHWLVISGQILYTSAGDAADFTFSLPGAAAGSPAIETSELVGGTGTGNDTSTTLGHGIWFDNGVGWKALWPRYASTTTVGFFTVNQKWWNSLAASGDSLNFTVRLPITGW